MGWERLADLPTRRDYCAAVVLEGRGILVLGGVPSGGTTVAQRRRVDLYDPGTATGITATDYEQLPDMAVAVTKCRAVRIGAEVIAFGVANGEGGDGLIVQIMDLTGDTWSTDAAWKMPDLDACGLLPEPGDAFAVVVDGGDAVILAGIPNCDGSTYELNTVWRFTAATRTWTRVSVDAASFMPHPVASSAAVVIDGIAHLFGGDDYDTLDPTSTHSQRLDLSDDVWLADVANITPREVADADAILVDGEAWVIGAYPTSPEVLNEGPVQIYNAVTNFWREGESVPEFKIDHAAVVYEERPYLFGGEDNDLDYTHAWVYIAPELVQGDRPFGYADLAVGHPAHVFVSNDGGAAQPVVGNFRMHEEANGGIVAAAGRIRSKDVADNEDIFRSKYKWRSTVRQTGELIFHGDGKEPGGHPGIVDISADGIGRTIPAREFRTYLVYTDDAGLWRDLHEEPLNTISPPEDGIDGFTINGGTGNLAAGSYRYAVTFVTAEHETGLGPDATIDVLIGEAPANIRVRKIPRGGAGVTARKLYRSDPGMGANEFRLVTTINDNTTDEFDDSTASVAANALAPKQPAADPISVSIEEEVLVVEVAADETVLASQQAGFVCPLPGGDMSGAKIVIAPNRDLADWELRIATAESAQGPWTHETTIDLAGEQSKMLKFAFTNPDDVDAVRVIVKRKTDGADTDPLKIVIKVRLYGVANLDDDYPTDAVIRDFCRRTGVSDRLVKPSGTPAGPQLWRSTNWAAVLDFNALLTGPGRWVWGIFLDGHHPVMRFAATRQQRFVMADPEVQPDLLPLPRYSRIRVFDAERRLRGEATANPNLLEEIRTLNVSVPFAIPRDLAQMLAQRLADFRVQRRWYGTFVIPRAYSDTGVPVSHWEVHAGYQVLIPPLRAFVDVDDMEHLETYSIATASEGDPIFDRFLKRFELNGNSV